MGEALRALIAAQQEYETALVTVTEARYVYMEAQAESDAADERARASHEKWEEASTAAIEAEDVLKKATLEAAAEEAEILNPLTVSDGKRL